ncbi:hypothetical protein [Herpetosiphon giganteus]|uniref:hypothetical protein n=1 Tax=Herpetosiphon giganteus TaxID=2029754 RepID=UPI001958EB50|nr:hypothetical protein [Herpetosiphon giganteus]MBM7842344.1 hypothetical protein [Herpetosiphon giganteus]
MYNVPANQTKLPAPLGLKIVGIRYGLGMLMIAAVTVVMGLELQAWRSDTFFIPLLLLLACAGITALYARVTWGIFKQQEQARKYGVFLEFLALAISAFDLLTGNFEAGDLISVGISVAVIWYLRRAETLDYFYEA